MITFLSRMAMSLVLVLVSAGSVFALNIPANTWNDSYFDTIERVYPLDEGFAFVLSTHTYVGHGTSCNGGRQFWVRTSDPNYEQKAATVMAAFLSGRQIQVYWDTADSCRAHVNRLQIR